MGFSISKVVATLKAMNVRTQDKGGEPCPAVDLKFEVHGLNALDVLPLFGVERSNAGDFLRAFWDQRDPRFSGIETIKSWTWFDRGHRIQFVFPGQEIDATKLHKFEFKPRADQTADIVFTASISDPPEHMLEAAAQRLGTEVYLTVSHDPELPFSVSMTDNNQQED